MLLNTNPVVPDKSPPEDFLLELHGVSKTFPGVKALSNVELTLRPGEVLGLCGENGAGKSTLMKILTGIYQMDPGGQIILGGKPVSIGDVNHARKLGLSIIHQELNMVPDLTVAQNLCLGQQKYVTHGFINDRLMLQDTQQLFNQLGMKIDPRAYCRDLSVAQLQMVEIARALSYDSKILIMDEPSAALTVQETEALFGMIRDFVTPETGLIYISHRMPEIAEITNRVSVLRDGEYIGTVTTNKVEMREVISMMVGREVADDARPRTKPLSNEIVLEVTNLATKNLLSDINFTLKKGEILGFAGLMGAGRTELARCISGADPRSTGIIRIHGKPAKISSAAGGVRNRIGYLSEDRKRYGLLLEQDVKTNSVLATLSNYTSFGLTHEGKIRLDARRYRDRLRIKTPSVNQPLNKLSGGNQQKVVIAKWLIRDSDILIFDEPTRGIDVGAKEEIYQLLEDLTAQGKSIIMISSELPEILRMSHRIAVMAHGKITGILNNEQATQQKIMELATEGPNLLKGDES